MFRCLFRLEQLLVEQLLLLNGAKPNFDCGGFERQKVGFRSVQQVALQGKQKKKHA